jgi:hypothetical protein
LLPGWANSTSTVSAYEKMQANPPVDAFAAWARAVGMEFMVDLKDPRAPFQLVHAPEPLVPLIA